MKTNSKTTQLTMLGLIAAVLFLMAYTPLGYLNIGPLAVTFNTIPVAIAVLVLGPAGGAVAGGVFGLTSFLQATGIAGTSVLGSALFAINPVFSFILCFAPRILDGFLLGHIFRFVRKKSGNMYLSCCVTGFFAAFLNTVLFMSTLLLLFGRTDYMQGFIQGQNLILFVVGFVGINAVMEMLSSTILTGAIGAALYKARFIPGVVKKVEVV